MGITSSTGCSQMVRPNDTGRLSKPANLRCEYRVNPLGVDIIAPRLSWEVRDSRRGAVQTAYRIVVSTDQAMSDPKAVVWDTGKVESDQSIHVAYGGKALASGKQYFWKVRTWDAGGAPSEYSEPAWWEMGLLEPSDWRARWITAGKPPQAEPPMEMGQWIWHEKARGDKKAIFCRRSFDIDPGKKIERAVVKITADDHFVLFINGHKVGEGRNWALISQYDVSSSMQSGKNVIAVRAYNGGGACGLLVAMRVQLEGGKTIEIKSDSQWRCTCGEPDAWTAADLDDSDWDDAVVVGEYGDEPWKNLKEKHPPRQSLCMRKAFTLKGKVSRARAYASGLGIYVLRLNGRRVGSDIFTPGWTHYYKRVQYQTYDVTDLLRQGDNAIGVILGNGWWSGGLGWRSDDQYSQGNLRCIVQLNVEYADGTQESVVTDGTWQAHPSPIIRNTYYHGETYDARREMPGWDAPGFDTGKWWTTEKLDPQADLLLVAQRCETIQVTEELAARQVSQPDKGVYIFDFGQNASGWVRLKVKDADRGTDIRLRFGEELDPNGRLYRDNYRSAEATDYYVCKGDGEEVWEPMFTYRGFRYCEVTGYPVAAEKRPPSDALVACVLHSATPEAGRFECSNWLINRIHQNVSWGLRSNMHSVPTDCPQRDERLGWMGDGQAFAHSSCFLRHMASFYSKWMFDMADSQGDDGAVTNVSPAKVVTEPAKPGWGDAVVVIPWTVYRFYGDKRVIEENYDAMAGWVEYMRSKSKEDLYEVPGYGDWVPVVKSPTEWIGSAYYYYSTRLLSKMAAVIGKTEEAARYAELADKIAAAFNAKHLNKDTNNYVTGTQTCNILPLFFGITPPDRAEPVLQNIVKDIEARGDHLSTGFLGTTYLLSLLADRGQQELAYRLAAQDTYPSWGYMVRHGATTIWERWNSDKMGPEMNSRNHFALGTVVRWFFEDLAGINPDPRVPGFKRIIIRPRPVGDVAWAHATYPSMYGPITSMWRRADDGFVLGVTIPANTTAEVFVPMMGAKRLPITESGKTILKLGKPAARVPGVTFLRMEGEYAVFKVKAGHYAFTASYGRA